jgi:hypothetical protein
LRRFALLLILTAIGALPAFVPPPHAGAQEPGEGGEPADTSAVSAEPVPTGAGGESESEIQGRLEGVTEQVQVLQSDTDKLKKFKFSGYVQARWETSETSSDSVKVSGFPPTITTFNTERFYIRRARLKLTYDSGPLSQAVVYFDAGTDRSVRLLEAYVSLYDPWTVDHRHGFTIGQMNVPFGYEIERSSSLRELPERSRAENVLFPGERDRGLKLVSKWGPWLETVVGLYNGGGINHPDFPNTDPSGGKDFVGRARASLGGRVDGAVSYYGGKNTIPLSGTDVETDKTRLGLDAQGYYELPRLGGGTLRAELYTGEDVNSDSIKVLVIPPSAGNPVRELAPGANPGHLATDFVGWYVMWVQNLGEKLQFAARYDRYDPNLDTDHDQFERTGFGINYFYDGHVRLSVSYDIPVTEAGAGGGSYSDPDDNLMTVQFQHKF